MYRRLSEKRNVDTGRMNFYYFMGWGKYCKNVISMLLMVMINVSNDDHVDSSDGDDNDDSDNCHYATTVNRTIK